MCGSNIKSLMFFMIIIRSWKRRLGDLRHNNGSAESCCLPTLTRFTGTVCTGPNRHIQKRMCTYGTQLIKQCTRKHNFAFNVRKVAMIVFMTTLSNLLKFQVISRRSARAAESARLESVCGETHRGFESHLLRAKILFYGIISSFENTQTACISNNCLHHFIHHVANG